MNINIPDNVETIINHLENNGYEACIVGGCVRDSIIGRNPHDWDICTSAKPNEILKCFSDFKVIETGIKHGTVTIVVNHEMYEVTTYRIDGKYSDNRRPDDVEFTDNIKEDLSRRDFTINSIAYNTKVGLIDPFNGIYDIEMKLIRCVGDASNRFQEDALRILRAMRFSIQLGFRIVIETYYAMTDNKSLINNVSAERINSELVKMLDANKPVLNHFQRCRDIIAEFIPEFVPCFDFDQNNKYHEFDVYNHILHALDNYKGQDIIVKLSLLFHDIGKPDCYTKDLNGGHFIGHGIVSFDKVNEILRRLKFDNNSIKSIAELVLYHDSTIEPTNKTIKRWLNKIGEIQFRRLLEIRTADMLAHSSINRQSRLDKQEELYKLLDIIAEEEQCFNLKDLDINGKDLIDIGIKEGKEIGIALNTLLEMVISEKINNNKCELTKKIKEIYS